MSMIHLGSTDAILDFETNLGASARAIADAIAVVLARVNAGTEHLAAAQVRCQSQIRYWTDRIVDADEDEDTSEYSAQVENWQEKLEGIQRSRKRLEGGFDEFQRLMRQLEELTTERTPKARAFLRQRVSEVEDYIALRPDASSAGSSSGSTTSVTAKHVVTGYRRSEDDPRDWLWRDLYGPPPEDLPPQVGLESFLGPAQDQADRPQCVCFSLAALAHHDVFCRSGRWQAFNPDPIYHQCKARDGAQHEAGTTIRDAFKVAAKQGLVADGGGCHVVRGYARLQNTDEIRHAVSLRKVVMLGLPISSEALSAVGRDALVAPPPSIDGAHCMLVVGYDDSRQLLRVRNSWGTNWADTGHCWLSFSCLSRHSDLEAWTSVCEKVAAEPDIAPVAHPVTSGREAWKTSNFAWFDPTDVCLEGDDGPSLEWTGIPADVAEATLRRVIAMRPYLNLGELKGSNIQSVRERLAQATDSEGRTLFLAADLEAFDLYFGSDAVRIDSDGKGGFMVINGRHRLYLSQKHGLGSVPASISNPARKQLNELISGGK